MSQAATEGQEPSGAAGAATGQEPDGKGATGQEPGTQAGTSTDGHVDVESITDPALKAYVVKLNAENAANRADAAKHRIKAAELETWKTEQERAAETAEQTAAREATEAQAERERLMNENRALKVGHAIRSAAENAKAHDPDTVLVLIEPKVVLDDQGQPTNVAQLLTELRTEKPFLFKRAGANAGEGNGEGGTPGGDMNSLIRQAAGRS